ncbi:MAG: type II toxin-antitoxin system Phd/YefM family antitoxin [Chlamydiota bacterium]
MSSIPFSEARAHLTEIVNNINYKGKRFVVTKNGKEVAAFISVEDLALLEELEDKIDLKEAKKAKKTLKKEKLVSWEEAKKELGL